MTNPVVDAWGTSRWLNEQRQLHRLDGPAVRTPWGYSAWYVRGVRCPSAEQFCERAGISGKEKTMFLLKHGDEFQSFNRN